jgi:hypothetical protein
MITSSLTAPSKARLHYLNMTLWTFQGLLAMFFIAAGYAKLTESMDNLTVLMQWPAMARPGFVRALGMVELVMALMVLTPLLSWRVGRPVLLLATACLMALEIIMLMLHMIDMNLSLALINLALLALTIPVFWYRRHI